MPKGLPALIGPQGSQGEHGVHGFLFPPGSRQLQPGLNHMAMPTFHRAAPQGKTTPLGCGIIQLVVPVFQIASQTLERVPGAGRQAPAFRHHQGHLALVNAVRLVADPMLRCWGIRWELG